MALNRWLGALSAALLFCTASLAAADPAVEENAHEGRRPWMVGALLLHPIAAEVFKHIRAAAPAVPEPKIESNGAVKDFDAFCSGPDAGTPSIFASTRRMGGQEFEHCTKNGVALVEIQIGLEALVLVTRREDEELDLSIVDFYRAIAAELPFGDDFLPNTMQTWKDVNPKLPPRGIHVIVPGSNTAARAFVNNRFLQGACREIAEYKNIFSADERVAQCIGLRKDGIVTEVPNPYTVEAVLKALDKEPHGAIAIVALRYATQAAERVKPLPLEGIKPNRETVSHLTYPAVRRLYFYVKRQHVKDYTGKGPVLGLREFISEATRETAIGDGGYLVPLGVVPMTPERRAEVRDGALRLTPLDR